MRLSRFFIDRPIFAAVIAVIITLVGAISYFFLPRSSEEVAEDVAELDRFDEELDAFVAGELVTNG